MDKCLIIGCGWYGCHLATILESKNIDFDLIDKTNDFFTGSSSKNQNRLHLGFHYPRSYNTRKECVIGYKQFIDKYFDFCYDNINIYLISKESLVDYQTYINIYTYENIEFKIIDKIDTIQINNEMISGKYILNNEKVIDFKKAKEYFKNKYINKMIKFDNIDLTKYKYIFDCTYGQTQKFENVNYEIVLTLIYFSDKVNNTAITIMDGNFFSLYTYDKNLYTLTNVKYSVLYNNDNIEKINEYINNIDKKIIEEKKELMEIDVNKYILNFDELYVYSDYYVSIKCKPKNDNTSDRSIKYKIDNNYISFYGGKITGIFEMEDIIFKELKMFLI